MGFVHVCIAYTKKCPLAYTGVVILFRILRQVIIIFFLLITASAFLLTLFRIDLPFLRPIVAYSYGMMAPYQGYERTNMELFAEGEIEGVWEAIDLDPYFPVLRGEKIAREFFMIYSDKNPEAVTAAATRIAQKLLHLENSRGHSYTSVRLLWHQWYPSPEGFAARRTETLMTRLLATVHE